MGMNNILQNKRILKILVIILAAAAVGIFIYLVALPFYPSLKYKIVSQENAAVDYKDVDTVKEITEKILGLPTSDEKTETAGDAQSGEGESGTISATTGGAVKGGGNGSKNSGEKKASVKIANTLIIPKISVKIPIIQSEDENYGLDHGAWKLPKSSTPEEIGNMIITGHRFKYLPPSNLTFFLFHKLETGDVASVIWDGKPYYYKIKEIKKISADDTSILKQTKTSTLTMYTCDPIYSTKNRLVIVADLVE
jgi:LPXTG-site transpeptidase (sortase) family protein